MHGEFYSWSGLARSVAATMTIIFVSAEFGYAAGGCAPGTRCLPVTNKGAPAPEPGPFTAQCSGTFPDFVTPSAMAPASGPWFKLSQAFPAAAPTDDAPWLRHNFADGMKGANDYLYALRDYSFEGMINAEFKPELNNVRPWFHMPLMNFGPRAREPVRGLTSERPVTGPELGLKTGVTVHNYAVGFYNAAGAFTIGQVWKTNVPDLSKARFPQGAMSFKLLFTDAKPDDFQGADILAGAPQWTIATSGGLKAVRLLQMDVAAVDSNSPTGWVFGTFAFDSAASDASPWLRLRPVGLSWGNDEGFTPADQQAGKKLQETTISDQAPAYAAAHLGWAGRANGPVDNPISGCLSCHSTAQSPPAPITFNDSVFHDSCTSDQQKLLWFRNLRGDQPFGTVNASTCTLTNASPTPPRPLDFSLQMSVAVQNVLQFQDVNPCAPPPSPLAPVDASIPFAPGDYPAIER
jgi:hypothetical protein